MKRFYKLENKKVVKELREEHNKLIKPFEDAREELREEVGFELITGSHSDGFWMEREKDKIPLSKFYKFEFSDGNYNYYKINQRYKKGKELVEKIFERDFG